MRQTLLWRPSIRLTTSDDPALLVNLGLASALIALALFNNQELATMLRRIGALRRLQRSMVIEPVLSAAITATMAALTSYRSPKV